MITEWITLSKSWVRDLSPQGSWDQRARHCFRAPQMQEHGEVRQGLSGTDQANYTLARHIACQTRGNLPASDFRFTLNSCWCPRMPGPDWNHQRETVHTFLIWRVLNYESSLILCSLFCLTLRQVFIFLTRIIFCFYFFCELTPSHHKHLGYSDIL